MTSTRASPRRPPFRPRVQLRSGACSLACTAAAWVVGCSDEPAPGVCALEPGDAIHRASYTSELVHPYSPDQLVADADYVYFADGRAIHRVPRCGGPAELLLADARPFHDGLALADGALYWLEGDDGELGPRVQRAPIDGGPPETLATYEGYSHRLRVDEGAVVWNASVAGFPDRAQLLTLPSEGGQPRVLAEHRYGWSFDLADGVVYAAGYLPDSDPEASEQVLFALPLTGAAPVVLADGFADDYPAEPVVGGADVYYLRRWSSETVAVERVARTGGPAESLEIAGAAELERLLYAGEQLYGVETDGTPVRLSPGEAAAPLVAADALAQSVRVFADPLGLFVADSSTTCVEWWSDPSGEPPGMSCVRESIDVRLLWLGP